MNMPYPGYDKTSFRIDYMLNGEYLSYEGRQDFGDGDGSLVDHIEKTNKYYVDNPGCYENYRDIWPEEKVNEMKESHEFVVEHLVPYLKMHCTLAKTEESAMIALDRNIIPPYEKAYLLAIIEYVKLSRESLNKGDELPKLPRLEDYEPGLKNYINKVKGEIAE